MRAYVIRRVLLVIPTLLILTIVVFLSVSLIPGDIIDAMGADLQDQRGFDRAALRTYAGIGCAYARAVWTLDRRCFPARHPRRIAVER